MLESKNIIKDKIREVELFKQLTQAAESTNYYYWDGYLAALHFAVDLLLQADVYE